MKTLFRFVIHTLFGCGWFRKPREHTSPHKYHFCSICGNRTVKIVGSLLTHPLDHQWLDGKAPK